jgi:hypothetical protein
MEYAREGAQAHIQRLKAELAALEAAFGGRRVAHRKGKPDGPATVAQQSKKRRKMSAAARKRIGDAAKRRWAKWRAEKSRK